MGCLIAGFGVYQLMVPCSSQEPDKALTSARARACWGNDLERG